MSNRVLRHLEPARSVLMMIGRHADPGVACEVARLRRGIREAVEITGRTEATVYKWMYPRDRGGTGGFVPSADQQMMLRWSAVKKAGLAADHFFPADIMARQVRRRPRRARLGKETARP